MTALILSAIVLGAAHALAPDHWLPFAALARIRGWSSRRLAVNTLLAGSAHLLSGLVLGGAGLALGASLFELAGWESERAAWMSNLLIGFGLLMALLGAKRAFAARFEPVPPQNRDARYWTLFALVLFGPCEPLLPLAAASRPLGWSATALAVGAFCAATLCMMLAQAWMAARAAARVSPRWMARYGEMAGGLSIAAAAGAVRWLAL